MHKDIILRSDGDFFVQRSGLPERNVIYLRLLMKVSLFDEHLIVKEISARMIKGTDV